MEIILRRDPERVFTELHVLLAEGNGRIPYEMGRLCAQRWQADGYPADRLFVVTGDKVLGSAAPYPVITNESLEYTCWLPREMEAVVLYRALVSAGIPDDQIIFENKSKNTHGQAVEVYNLLHDENVACSLTGPLAVTLYCHDLHESVGQRVSRNFTAYSYTVWEILTVRYRGDLSQSWRVPHMWLPRAGYSFLERRATQRDEKNGWLTVADPNLDLDCQNTCGA